MTRYNLRDFNTSNSTDDEMSIYFSRNLKMRFISIIGNLEESHDGRFNLMAFNTETILTQPVFFKRRLFLDFNGAFGARRAIPFSRRFRHLFTGIVVLHVIIMFRRNKVFKFNSYVIPHLLINLQRNMNIYFNSIVTMSKDINIQRVSLMIINADVHVSKTMNIKRHKRLVLYCIIHAGKIMPYRRSKDIMFNGIVLMGLTRTAVVNIPVTIPPGGEIRINSDNFTADLLPGNVNILHLYNGDWVFLDRNTTELIITAGSDNIISGDLLYNWRFI